MKKLFISLLLLSSVSAFCQSVQFAGQDQFTKKFYISTDEVRVSLTGFNGQNSFSVSFSSMDDSITLHFNGTFNMHVSIFKGDRLVFLLSNDSTVSVVSPIDQATYPAVLSSGAPDGMNNTLNTVYTIDSNTIKKLIAHPIKSIRMYYNGGYSWVTNDSKSSLDMDFVGLARNFLRTYEIGRSKWLQR